MKRKKLTELADWKNQVNRKNNLKDLKESPSFCCDSCQNQFHINKSDNVKVESIVYKARHLLFSASRSEGEYQLVNEINLFFIQTRGSIVTLCKNSFFGKCLCHL